MNPMMVAFAKARPGIVFSDKVPKDIAEKVTKSKDELSEALKKDDISEIKQKFEDLKSALQEIGSSVYGQGQQGAGPSDSGPTPGPEGSENPDVSADANSEGQ